MLNYDIGIGWGSISTFGLFSPSEDMSISRNKNYLNLIVEENAVHVNGLLYFQLKNYFAYFNPGYSTPKDNQIQPTYSFEELDKTYGYSGLGYKNKWAIIQMCRGNEDWSSGNGIQLALNDKSESYDYFLLSSDYGNLRVRYFHGFLERTKDSINRYITGRGIEYTNKKSFVFGLSEIVIYSGENRQFDIAYLNPISSHVEIELNDRLNLVGTDGANAVWQIHSDLFLFNKLRISTNYLIDEFIFDKKLDNEKKHRDAFSLRISFAGINSSSRIIIPYLTLISVDKPTFRHSNGYNNFVQSGKPLGWNKGSDGKEIRIGVNYFNKRNIKINLSGGYSKIGDYSLVHQSFDAVNTSGDMDYIGEKASNSSTILNEITYSWKKFIFHLTFEHNQSSSGIYLGFQIAN